MNKIEFQRALGVSADGIIGPKTVAAFDARMRNLKASKLTQDDYVRGAALISVPVGHIRAIGIVEAGPQGSYDNYGRMQPLYERHKFRTHTRRKYNQYPALSGPQGGYGKYSEQWPKLLKALALDPEAAISSCSWGLFQVLGENWRDLGYASVLDMVLQMTVSEGAQLDAMLRYIKVNGLADELRACRKGDPASCVPFVSRYNGPGYAKNSYHKKLAGAL